MHNQTKFVVMLEAYGRHVSSIDRWQLLLPPSLHQWHVIDWFQQQNLLGLLLHDSSLRGIMPLLSSITFCSRWNTCSRRCSLQAKVEKNSTQGLFEAWLDLSQRVIQHTSQIASNSFLKPIVRQVHRMVLLRISGPPMINSTSPSAAGIALMTSMLTIFTSIVQSLLSSALPSLPSPFALGLAFAFAVVRQSWKYND